MYQVVGCGDCNTLWIITDSPETTTCPGCGTRHTTANLRALATSEDKETARQARTKLLAERHGVEDISDLLATSNHRPIDSNILDPQDTGNGTDLSDFGSAKSQTSEDRHTSGSQRDIVIAALRTLDQPTEADIRQFAEARGVPAEYVNTVLPKLVQEGSVSKQAGTYRLL